MYDDDDEYDPMEAVRAKQREDSKLTITCTECGLTTTDYFLAKNHSCDVEQQGGYCEDFPCCGHEAGDCNGKKYGSDESIKTFWRNVYDSGMDAWEIADLQDRMDRSEMGY